MKKEKKEVIMLDFFPERKVGDFFEGIRRMFRAFQEAEEKFYKGLGE